MRLRGIAVQHIALLFLITLASESCRKSEPNAQSSNESAARSVSLPLKHFPDDIPAVDSNLNVEEREVKVYNDMPDADYRLGNPHATWSFKNLSCPSQPVIVAGYKDLRGLDKQGNLIPEWDYLLEYRNLHCQPDERAYVLVGIHPAPGGWSNAVREQGVNLEMP